MDRVARSRARDRAQWLVRDHGAAAETILAAKLARPGKSRADRAFYRMIARELRIVRAAEAAGGGLLGRLLTRFRGRPRDGER